MLTKNASSVNAGSTRIRQPGAYRYQTISSIKIEKVIRKSTNATTTVAVGTISRGKYTLLIKLALLIRLLEASLNPVEKKVHGKIPARTIKGYGAVPSEGRRAIRPKMMVKTSMERTGRISAQSKPITVCLYRTDRSRHASTRNSSRYRQRSSQ